MSTLSKLREKLAKEEAEKAKPATKTESTKTTTSESK